MLKMELIYSMEQITNIFTEDQKGITLCGTVNFLTTQNGKFYVSYFQIYLGILKNINSMVLDLME